MALNLVRNSRVFFTTNVNSSTGVVQTTGFTNANTYELQVLDGFTFTQTTNQDTITVSEAGTAPVRGQRSFNTSLAPVSFSMSTYLRPANSGSAITAEESVLWNALLGTNDISTANAITVGGTISGVTYAFTAGVGAITIAGTSLTAGSLAAGDTVVIGGLTGTSDLAVVNAAATVVSISGTAIVLNLANPKASGAAITGITAGTVKLYKSAWAPVASNYSYVSSAGSNANQLQKFGMIFIVDNVTYVVDNCAMNQVVVDFGLTAIATAAWTGMGTALSDKTATINITSLTGNFTAKNTTAPFITNKLSTVSMSLVNALGSVTAGTAYSVALTGGSITINNNIAYVTPANLGVVNIPVTYYTATRGITGTMTAYMKTGSGVQSTGQLLADMLAAAATTTEPMATIQIAIGGSANATKVVIDLPSVTFSIPTVDVQAVVSTTINFTAEGSTPSATANANVFALDKVNDLAIRYYSA